MRSSTTACGPGAATLDCGAEPRSIRVLGAPIAVVDLPTVLDELARWIDTRLSRYVCVADVHSVMVARNDARHRETLDCADMVLPDGMPLVWTGRLRGERELERVCGPDLLAAACARSSARSWRHFFLGGADGVAEALSAKLKLANPDLQVCGVLSPPFRPLSDEEDEALVQHIVRAQPDIIWVGLGCPKQERWMKDHLARLPGAVMIGVGAAFDFHSGRRRRAPAWMQSHGLEWLHRLFTEPGRLWRRYLVDAPLFAGLSLLETLSLRVRGPARRPAASLTDPVELKLS